MEKATELVKACIELAPRCCYPQYSTEPCIWQAPTSNASVDEIAFLMQISPALVRQYQELYERYNTPECRERIDEIIAMVKARGFQPGQLDDGFEAPQVQKGGLRRCSNPSWPIVTSNTAGLPQSFRGKP